MITCMEALDFLAILPPQSVPLFVLDLPYGSTVLKWDKHIPIAPLWKGLERALAPDGTVLAFSNQPFTTLLNASKLKWFKWEYIWHKTVGDVGLNAKKRPLKRHENISVFCRKTAYYNPQMQAGEPYVNKRGSAGETTRDQSQAGYITVNKGTRYPSSVLYFANEVGLHPTQKPVPLLEFLILSHSRPDDLVVDITCGSGSAGVAARNTGRRYQLNDNDPDYVAIATTRLNQPYTLPLITEV